MRCSFATAVSFVAWGGCSLRNACMVGAWCVSLRDLAVLRVRELVCRFHRLLTFRALLCATTVHPEITCCNTETSCNILREEGVKEQNAWRDRSWTSVLHLCSQSKLCRLKRGRVTLLCDLQVLSVRGIRRYGNYTVNRSFGESGLFENELTPRHPQSRHTPHGGSEKSTQRKVPAGKGWGWARAVTVAMDRSMCALYRPQAGPPRAKFYRSTSISYRSCVLLAIIDASTRDRIRRLPLVYGYIVTACEKTTTTVREREIVCRCGSSGPGGDEGVYDS